MLGKCRVTWSSTGEHFTYLVAFHSLQPEHFSPQFLLYLLHLFLFFLPISSSHSAVLCLLRLVGGCCVQCCDITFLRWWLQHDSTWQSTVTQPHTCMWWCMHSERSVHTDCSQQDEQTLRPLSNVSALPSYNQKLIPIRLVESYSYSSRTWCTCAAVRSSAETSVVWWGFISELRLMPHWHHYKIS